MVKKEKKSPRGDKRRKDAPALIAELFRSLPDKRYSVKSLMAAVGATTRDEKERVRGIVRDLAAEGVIEQVSEGKYRLSHSERETVEGTVDMTSSGALYVIVEGMDKDIYVNASRTSHALHGDRVRVAITRKGRTGNPEGEVVEIVERSKKNYVGVVEMSEGDAFAFVRVDSRKMATDIFVPARALHGAKGGEKVLVKITGWPDTMRSPEGEIVDVFGEPGDNNAEMHAILAEFDLPYGYPEEVEKEAEKIPETITDEEIAARRDMRGVATFTIDPADAKDFDDALSIRRLENGNYEVGVHIADVTHYVKTDGVIDKEAQSRATSVYLVDRTIPMLPERLCNQICSLRPDEEKLCFSAVFELNSDAVVQNSRICRTIIKSDRRFTYEEAQEVIETGEGDYKEEILALNDLAKKLRERRFKSGAINFDRYEVKFEIDEQGKPVRVYFKVSKDANKLIEEFMLLANRTVAEFVGRPPKGKTKKTFVYRIHELPDPDKMENFASFIRRFGYKLKTDGTKTDVSKGINSLLDNVQGKPEENLIETVAIRAMQKARYSTENIGHYGLAFEYYTHFTSPIRRYPDMMVHRLLERYLAGGRSVIQKKYEDLCDHCSNMEQVAANAERASIKYKQVEFMQDKLGMVFDGVISGVTEWGLYVELNENKCEGLVPIRDLDDDYYEFDEKNYCLLGRRKKRQYRLGDPITIKVAQANLERKQLDFQLAE